MSAIRIEEVDALDCAFEPWDWPFERDRTAEIDAHWARLIASGRDLWDGRVLLCRDPAIETRGRSRVFVACYFETRFAAFLAWRDFGFPGADVFNGFAMAALRAADGPFLLGRMAARTANPGRVYFAAGTPDLDDLRGDRVDLEGSVMRELTEETGLTDADVTPEPGFTLVFSGQRIACMKPLRAKRGAAETIAQVAGFLAGQTAPELADLVAARGPGDLVEAMTPDFVLAYLRAVSDG